MKDYYIGDNCKADIDELAKQYSDSMFAKHTNKYQEALDYIKQYMEIYDELNGEDNISKLNKMNVNILQELVDNYSKIQQFDKAVFFNSDGLVVNGVSYEQLKYENDKYKQIIERLMFREKYFIDKYGEDIKEIDKQYESKMRKSNH